MRGQCLLLFGLLKGSSCGYLQNSENSSLPIFSSWANSFATVSDTNNITLCYSVLFKQPRQRKYFQSLVTLTKKCQTVALLLSCLINSVSENGNSGEPNSSLFFEWAVNCSMECMLIRPWGSEFCFSYVIFCRKIMQRPVLFLIFNFQKWD